MLATHFVVAADIEITARFYSDILGGEVVWRAVHPGAPTYVKFSNIWIGINEGGGVVGLRCAFMPSNSWDCREP